MFMVTVEHLNYWAYTTDFCCHEIAKPRHSTQLVTTYMF